ncbi:HAMP domain-containing histidine kinase [Pedobacter sp. SD-b]|uniref:histidine kinase n=1 Tax=Pedobacter segetis TaxID=2793069 RepID=A0ABS1BID9_9SPHI|nr:HAMP domain-containing sensor histidine kinase [Pedobacter segetis]MBK0382607.1 HAMP domain-containing histidine kinase [Pedobacter segetis]
MKFLKLKIIISVYVCLIVLALYNTFHVYETNKQNGKQGVFAKLSTIASILSKQIDGDELQKITKDFNKKDQIKNAKQDSSYYQIHQQLKNIQKSSKITSPIYTLVRSNEPNKFLFAVTSSNKPYYLHTYHNPPSELIKNFDKGGDLDEYKDENGIWLSSFAPIKNRSGQVVAVVQIDKNFNEFLKDVNNDLINSILFIVLVYSVIGFFLYLFLKDVLKKEEAYIKTQKNYKNELEKEVKQRTNELNNANRQLVKVNSELESFFYSTSHDIRGPLCRILGLTSLAKVEDDKQEIVEMIEVESQKMDDMLKKMVLVNSIRTKEVLIEEVAVYDRINHILKQIKSKYTNIKPDIKIKIATQDLKKFHTDLEIFESIVTNIFDNSFKFSDNISPKIIINSFVDKDGIFSLTVENNGQKFSEIEINNAFELFKKANKKGDMDTIRLGLYTIKTCTDKLNGVVNISYNNGLTMLKVLLPDYYLDNSILDFYKKQLN